VIRHIVYGILMWVVCLYALYRGGWAERLTAASFLVLTYLSVLVMSPVAVRFHRIELALALVDISLFGLLLFISLRTKKFWPLWLAAMQGLTILSHLAPYVPHMVPWAYHRAVVVWYYPMLIILGYATRVHHRESTGGHSSKG
jgi:hypothetical protein